MKGAREKTCVRVWRWNRICEKEQPSVWSWLKATSVAASDGRRVRDGLGTGAAPGPLARQRRGFARFELHGRRSFLARSGADFVTSAALSQGQLFSSFELRGRRNTFERSDADFVAGTALSQGQVQISWQAQHFRKAKCRIRGKRSTFARSSTEFVASTAPSQV